MRNTNELFLFEVALALWSRFKRHDTHYIDYARADYLTRENTVFFPDFEAFLAAPGPKALNVSQADKLELANTYDAAQAARGRTRRIERFGIPARATTCQRWDSLVPQPVYDSTGKHAGMLMPRMTQAEIAASPGIQGWSAPDHETRTR